jgi:hypothetical protein
MSLLDKAKQHVERRTNSGVLKDITHEHHELITAFINRQITSTQVAAVLNCTVANVWWCAANVLADGCKRGNITVTYQRKSNGQEQQTTPEG